MVMYVKLQIASVILQHPLSYKYTVYSPKTRNAANREEVYEFINSKISDSMIRRVLQPEEFEQHQGYGIRMIEVMR